MFFEAAFWGIEILNINNCLPGEREIKRIAYEIVQNNQQEEYWERIINNPGKDLSLLFDQTGSHYYSSTNNRYNFIANIFSALYDVDYSMHLKNPNEFKRIMSVNLQHNELKQSVEQAYSRDSHH